MELAGRQEKEVTRKAVAQGNEVQQKSLEIREQTFTQAAVEEALRVGNIMTEIQNALMEVEEETAHLN